jgi:hypothetical protein
MSEITAFHGRAQTLADITSTAHRHRLDLSEWAAGRHGAMLALDVSQRVASELSVVVESKCPPQVAAKRVARLLACYPSRASDNGADLEAYASVMLEEVQRFPDAILAEVLPDFSRTKPFRPSVAEIAIACQAELDKLHAFQFGLDRMGRYRAQEQAKAAEEQGRREKSAALAIEQDARAVRCFGAQGVCPGDFAGAGRTFQILRRLGTVSESPWMKWYGLVRPSADWAPWLALPMQRAGIFGRAHLGWARGQATIEELAVVQKHLADGDERAARTIVGEIEQRPLAPEKAVNVDLDRIGVVSQEIEALAEVFRDLLTEPVAGAAEMAP